MRLIIRFCISCIMLFGLSILLHAQDAYDLDWIPSSDQIVVAMDETVRVYDTKFNLIKVLNEQDNFPHGGLRIKLSPNGAYLGVLYLNPVLAPQTNKGIQIWDLSSEQMILNYPNVRVDDFAWSPNSQVILLHEFDEVNTKNKLNFIDITSGNIIHSIETPLDKGRATTIYWSAANYLVLDSKTIDIWRINLTNFTQTYIGQWQPNGYAGAFTFSPNGLQFAAAVENSTSELQIVNVQTLATEYTIPLSEGGIKTVWRPNGLFVWQRDGRLSYITQPSDQEISFSFALPKLRQFTWDFNGMYIFTVNQSGVASIRDAANGNILHISNLVVVPTSD